MASNPASSPPPVSQALDLLAPALGILDSFAHRNKNQHRLSKWWAQFDMLRRGARKLAADLRACLESQARTASASSGGGGKKKKAAAALRERDDAVRATMEARARHLGEQIVPRAFLAFTQLAADNQYAHLGLALVGVLAQVNAAISLLVPALSDGGGGDVLASEPVTTSGQDPGEVADLGVAVSRSEVTQHLPVPANKLRAKPAAGDLSPVPTKTKAEDEALSQEGTRTSVKLEKKPRKSKKRMDEFDSLFNQLEAEKPAKKKKKRAKGDEFDDLFSSLV